MTDNQQEVGPDWRTIGSSFPVATTISLYDKHNNFSDRENDSIDIEERRNRKGKKKKHELKKKLLREAKSILSQSDSVGLILDKHTVSSDNQKAWHIDNKGDREMLAYGSLYRLDIPVYDVTATTGRGTLETDKTISLIVQRAAYNLPMGNLNTSTPPKLSSELRYSRSHRYWSKFNRMQLESADIVRLRYPITLEAKRVAKATKAVKNSSIFFEPCNSTQPTVLSNTFSGGNNNFQTTFHLHGYGTIFRYDIPIDSTMPASTVIPSTSPSFLPFSAGLTLDLDDEAKRYTEGTQSTTSISFQNSTLGDESTSLSTQYPYVSDAYRSSMEISRLNTAIATACQRFLRAPSKELLVSWITINELQKQLYNLQTNSNIQAQVNKSSLDVLKSVWTRDYVRRRNDDIQASLEMFRNSLSCQRLDNLQTIDERTSQNLLLPLQILRIRLSETFEEPCVVENHFKSALSECPLCPEIYHESLHHSMSILTGTTLESNLGTVRAQVASIERILKNKEAMRRFSVASENVTAILGETTKGLITGGSNEDLLPTNLHSDICNLRIDALFHQVLLLTAAGHTERAVALAQAYLETYLFHFRRNSDGNISNFSTSLARTRPTDIKSISNANVLLQDFEKFWESEFPRLGDARLFPTIGVSEDSSGRGMCAWAEAGRPDTDTVAVLAQIVGEASTEDYETLTSAWSRRSVSKSHILGASSSLNSSNVASMTVHQWPGPSFDDDDIQVYISDDDGESDTSEAPDKPLKFVEIDYGHERNKVKGEKKSRHKLKRKHKHKRIKHDSVDKDIHYPVIDPIANNITRTSAAVGVSEEDNVDEDGYRMVYSRLHGYKIRMLVKDADTGRTYRKILSQLSIKEDGEDLDLSELSAQELLTRFRASVAAERGQRQSDCSASRLRPSQLALVESRQREYLATLFSWEQFDSFPQSINEVYNEIFSILRPYAKLWMIDALLSSLHFRPLRVSAREDVSAAAELPDRVVLAEDLRSLLHQSNVELLLPDVDVQRQPLKLIEDVTARVVIRTLQSLDLVFPRAAHSHSQYARSLSSLGCAEAQAGDGGVLYSLIMGPLASCTLNESRQCQSESVKKSKCSGSGWPWCLSILTKLDAVVVTPDAVLNAHIVEHRLQYASKLSFLLKLISDLVRIGRGTSMGMLATNEKIGSTVIMTSSLQPLSSDLLCDLASVYLVLQTEAYLVAITSDDLSVSTAPLPTIAQSSTSLLASNKSKESFRQSLRAECRRVVEQAQHDSDPSTLDLRLWGAYIDCESRIDGLSEILKIGDKLLKALKSHLISEDQNSRESSQRPQSLNATLSNPLASVPGALQLHFSLLRALIGIGSTGLSSDTTDVNLSTMSYISRLCKALGLCVTLSKGGLAYDGCLRPVKAASTKGMRNKRPERELATNTSVSVSDSMESIIMRLANGDLLSRMIGGLQLLCAEVMETLQIRVTRTRSEKSKESSINSVRLHVEACSRIDATPDLYYAVVIGAWSRILGAIVCEMNHSLQVAGSSAGSYLGSGNALAEADQVFLTSLGQLRALLDPTFTHTHDSAKTFDANTYSSNEGLAAREALLGETWSSEAEMAALVCMQRLHLARVELHLWVQSVTDRETRRCLNSSSLTGLTKAFFDATWALRTRNDTRSASVTIVACSGLQDFPLNSALLHIFTQVEMNAPGGISNLRAYFKTAATRRIRWGEGLMPVEAAFTVLIEIMQATKLASSCSISELERDQKNARSKILEINRGLAEEYSQNNSNNKKSCTSGMNNNSLESAHGRLCASSDGLMTLGWGEDCCRRVHRVLETLLLDPRLRRGPMLWEVYCHLFAIFGHYLILGSSSAGSGDLAGNCINYSEPHFYTSESLQQAGRSLFYRATQSCSWAKSVWMLPFGPLLICFASSQQRHGNHQKQVGYSMEEGMAGSRSQTIEMNAPNELQETSLKDLEDVIQLIEERGLFLRRPAVI